jgi:glycosyltransferase involved in cell wall biosynthesis
MNYSIITPAKNEEKYIEETICSVLKQKILPKEWIIVDDNSTDKTSFIINKYAKNNNFIKLIKNKNLNKYRLPGANVVNAFIYGYKNLVDNKVDLICKLDADLKFESDYFCRIISAFENDNNLGIASANIIEVKTMKSEKKHHPELSLGANKVYRIDCFEKISPFEPVKGWDFIDNMKAQYYGYSTKILPFSAIHLKPIDSVAGFRKENYLKGYYDAYFRYSLIFFLLKAIKKTVFEKPYFLNGFYYTYGFMHNTLYKNDFYHNKNIIAFVRKFHKRRLHNLFQFNGKTLF